MKHLVLSSLIALLFSLYCYPAAAESTPAPFDRNELEVFCKDLPIVLSVLDLPEKHQYLAEVTDDFSQTIFQQKDRAFPGQLSPERFNYILNHTILAGVIKDMGGFGQEKVSFLEEQRKKVAKDKKLTSEEKQHILRELDSAVDQVKKLARQTAAIPHSELYLLWEKKEILNNILQGVVPIEKKRMIAR